VLKIAPVVWVGGVGGGIWRRSGEEEYCRNIATGLLCPQKRTQMILPK